MHRFVHSKVFSWAGIFMQMIEALVEAVGDFIE